MPEWLRRRRRWCVSRSLKLVKPSLYEVWHTASFLEPEEFLDDDSTTTSGSSNNSTSSLERKNLTTESCDVSTEVPEDCTPLNQQDSGGEEDDYRGGRFAAAAAAYEFGVAQGGESPVEEAEEQGSGCYYVYCDGERNQFLTESEEEGDGGMTTTTTTTTTAVAATAGEETDELSYEVESNLMGENSECSEDSSPPADSDYQQRRILPARASCLDSFVWPSPPADAFLSSPPSRKKVRNSLHGSLRRRSRRQWASSGTGRLSGGSDCCPIVVRLYYGDLDRQPAPTKKERAERQRLREQQQPPREIKIHHNEGLLKYYNFSNNDEETYNETYYKDANCSNSKNQNISPEYDLRIDSLILASTNYSDDDDDDDFE